VDIDVLLKNRHISRSALSELHEGAWQWACHQLHGDTDAADEVMQTVYVMLLEGRAHFNNRSSLKTWLYAVIRNACRRHHRDLARQRLWLWRQAQTSTTEQASDAGDSRSLLDDAVSPRMSQALQNLPPRQRDVIELTILGEFTLADCAQILGLRIGSVRTHYHRAKENLRAQAKNWADEDV
jgi:RNA polymerase sigma-70 factor (ECF subfamily)